MRVSAANCRIQEQRQRIVAEQDPLESRRKIATVAAAAWAKEALLADKREAGHLNPRDKLDAEITLEFARETEADAMDDGE